MKRRDVLVAIIFTPMLLHCGQKDPGRPKSTATDEAALVLLRKMQAALGGADRLAAVRDLDWTVSAKTWLADGTAGADGTRRIRWIWPNVFRKDQQAGYGTVIEFFDGTGGWEVVPDRGFLELKGSELEIVRREVLGFRLNVWLADRDPDYQVSSGGEGIIRITRKKDPGAWEDIVLDPASGLPVRTLAAPLSGTVTTSYQRVRQRMEYVEWQVVEGIRWPHKTINFHDDVKRAEITRCRSHEFAIDSAHASRSVGDHSLQWGRCFP